MSGKFPKNLLLSNKFMNIINAGLLGYGLVNKDYFDDKTFDVIKIIIFLIKTLIHYFTYFFKF